MKGEDTSRAVIFGRGAAAYDEARSSYPNVAVHHILSLVPAVDAVEVGAGTGKATVSFARDGLHLTCLEPSPEMAAVLEAKQLHGVAVVVARFEDWEAEPESIDLVFAAQSWHWVDPETGFHKALTSLRPGGVLALLWNIPLNRYAVHRAAYTRYAPHLLEENDVRIQRRDDHDWCADMEETGFVDTRRFTQGWSRELTSTEYRRLYSTYSDHMMLEESPRNRLLDALAADVEDWGGTATIQYRTEVFSGRSPSIGRR